MLYFVSLLACRTTPKTVDVAAVIAGEGDPAATLEAAASELDVSVRARALGLLITTSETVEVWGPRAVYDPSEWVQRAGVDALAVHPDPAAAELVASLASRSDASPYVRSHAAVELIATGRTAPDLGWKDTSAHWHRAPLALPAAIQGDAEALKVLREDLAQGDFPLEIEFYLDLGGSGLDVADALEASRARVEEELELPIAAAQIGLGDKRGEAHVKKALNSDDIERRLEAVDYLAELDGEVAGDLLKKAAVGNGVVQDWAELALIARGDRSPQAALDALVLSDREARQQAVWALSCWLETSDVSGRSRKQAHKALVSMLGDPEPVVVMAAVQGLGRAGQMEDRGLLAGFLALEDRGLRVEAAGAILAIESRDASTDGLASVP
ncbi:MAG: hypothetical protein GY913_28175 [Proteobacteria bacterium]|nr:hypothetical protein [Pseudomonadota bacterium]MCP4920789.1 hypothetical protein [Pseudomonadota bacterium]